MVLYATTIAPRQRSFMETLKEKFGLSVETVTGRGPEVIPKILAERRAGLYLGDVYLSGLGVTFVSVLKPAGAFDPLEPALILPDVTDSAVIERVWWGGKLLWGDKARFMLFFMAYPSSSLGVNTNLVKPGEIKSYRDLLDPKWKGKITMNDPTVGGSGNKWFTAMAEGITSLDYLRELAKQEPLIVRDQRQQVEWLAHGKYPIAISPRQEMMTEFIKAGAPIMHLTPQEGSHLTAGAGGISLINKAPHPNASRLFINWLVTKEGQTVWSRAQGTQSARLDVPIDFLDPTQVREPGVKYLLGISEEFAVKAAQYVELAKEIFGVR